MPGSGTAVPPEVELVLPPEVLPPVEVEVEPPEVEEVVVVPPEVEEVVVPPDEEDVEVVEPPEVEPPEVVVVPPEVVLVEVLVLDVVVPPCPHPELCVCPPLLPQVKPPACAGAAAAKAPSAIAEMNVRFIIKSIPVPIAMVADQQRKGRAICCLQRGAVVNCLKR